MWERALKLKEKLRAGKAVHGAWLSLPDPVVAEIFATAGFDYVLFETEHSPWGLESLQIALMAFNGTDTVPIVRVPWNDQVMIKQALDMGAQGILAPMVNTPDQARALVRACKYPPDGARGFGPRRASGYYRGLDAYMKDANDAVFIMPQIEDHRMAGMMDELLSIPGIDAIAIGPNDLSGSAGLLRQHDHPTVKGAIETIIAAAKAKGVPVCMGVSTPADEQAALIETGVRVLIVTSDLELLVRGVDRELAAGRAALG
jgi:2-keto-3-deoxy-L-rhamnonate aldolase RhmA